MTENAAGVGIQRERSVVEYCVVKDRPLRSVTRVSSVR